MTPGGEQMGEVEYAFSEALGHIRNATETLLGADDPSTETLLGADDPSTESLLLGCNALDLQALFGEVWPVWIPNERTAAESLECAETVLGRVLDHVPLAIWAALRSLRGQVSDGDR